MKNAKSSVRKINRSYQVTLPKKFRDLFSLNVGDMLELDTQADGLVIRPLELRRKKALRRLGELGGVQVDDELSKLPEDEIIRIVDEQRREVRTAKRRGKS